MSQLYNQKSQTQKRQALRNEATTPEQVLWRHLRARQISGIKFRRQYSIGPYVVDFYATKLRIAIEIDGDSHFTPEAQEYDREREIYIRACGIEMLRFTNKEVQENIEGVLEKIAEVATPPSLPSLEGRKKK